MSEGKDRVPLVILIVMSPDVEKSMAKNNGV